MILKSSIIISLITLVSRIFGYIREIMMAAFLGAGEYANAFHIAFRFSNVFRSFFAEGAFTASFVPIFSQKYHKSPEEALAYGSKIKSLLIITLIILTIIVEIFMPQIMLILAPGFVKKAETFKLVILLSRITFPYLIFMSLSALYGGMLSSINRFNAIALSPVILNLSMLIAMWWFNYHPQLVYILCASIVVSGIFQLFYVTINAHKFGLKLNLSKLELNRDISKFFRTMIPGIMSASVVQINLWVSTTLATFYVSAVSLLYYADRIVQLPLALIGTSISIVLLPSLSKLTGIKDQQSVNNIVNRTIEICMLLTIPTTVIVYFLSQPIIIATFEYGKFTSSDASNTAALLSIMIIALPAFILNKIFTPIFYANLNTKIPFVIALLSLKVNLGCNLLFLKTWHSFLAIAVSTTISSWFNCLALAIMLMQKKWWQLDRRLINKLLLVSFNSFIIYLAIDKVINIVNIRIHPVIDILFILAFLFMLFIGLCFISRTINLKELKQLMSRKKKK